MKAKAAWKKITVSEAEAELFRPPGYNVILDCTKVGDVVSVQTISQAFGWDRYKVRDKMNRLVASGHFEKGVINERNVFRRVK